MPTIIVYPLSSTGSASTPSLIVNQAVSGDMLATVSLGIVSFNLATSITEAVTPRGF